MSDNSNKTVSITVGIIVSPWVVSLASTVTSPSSADPGIHVLDGAPCFGEENNAGVKKS